DQRRKPACRAPVVHPLYRFGRAPMKTTRTLALTTLATAMALGSAFAQDTTPPTSQTPVTQPPPNEAAMRPTRHDATGATHGSEHGMKEKPSYAELDSRGDGRVARSDLAAHPKL